MRITRRVIITSAAVVTVAFSAYLFILYRQLERTFAQQEEFVPTRIYSDVSRIASPQPLEHVQARLHSLGYSDVKLTDDQLQFKLHPIEYPTYLIPENHPVTQAGDRMITLGFDGKGKNAVISSVQIEGTEVSEIFLEPELIATLSRSGEDSAGKQEIRDLVKFQDIPAQVWKAIIAIEDQHFLEHKGLDPRGLARAILVNLKTFSLAQGGSTITQQLVKNLMARRTKNIFRKFNEILLSLILEIQFDKERILERYLNEVYLGQVGSLEVHGVSEGAKHFFDKRLEDLNLAEVALMAGLIRGPGFYSPYRYKERALDRQRLVLKKMVETGQIAQAEADAALAMPIRLAPPHTSANKAPFFTDFVKAELIRQLKDKITEQEIISAGFRVYTTLDVTMNSIAQKSVSQGLTDLEARLKVPATDRLEGALAAVDHSNGYIRALIGGRNYAQSNFNRILNMRRQVGSTFKPLVFLAAIDKGEDPNGIPYGPGHPAEDAPWKLVYDHGKQSWSPRNYEKDNLGWMSYRNALALSINTIAAKLGAEIGIDQVIATARELGIESDLPEVPSLSLGVAELSPVELLRVYATIANHGIQDELTVIRGITQNDGSGYARFVYHPEQVFDPGPADLLTDMLQSVFIEGTAKDAIKMGFDRPAAGKTGTTSNYRDAWFAGYTPQLTTVVWVGMDQTAAAPPVAEKGAKPAKKTQIRLTGAGAALPIWVNFMKEALSGEAPAPFPLSPHLTNTRIDRHSGKMASPDCPDDQTSVEKYVSGREPKLTSCEPVWPTSPRIMISN